MNLLQSLDERLSRLPDGALVLGFSGGLDSTVLLHALAALPAARARGLCALHVDHGLQPASAAWSAHCQRVARALDVPLQVARVQVPRGSDGPEGAARRARWQAFREHTGPDDILVLAQHRADQAETVLLRLMRGAGPAGLKAMAAFVQRDDGVRVWRPLLDVSRAALEARAGTQRLDWIEDPSNADTDLDRNHLRHEVLPRLRERWPAADALLAQVAARQADATALEHEIATALLARCSHPLDHVLLIAPLRAASRPARWAALRLWLRRFGAADLGARRLQRIDDELLGAPADATPRLDLRSCVLRRYRNLLFALFPEADAPFAYRLEWDGLAPLVLPHEIGALHITPPPSEPLALVATNRSGGERLRLHGGGPRRALKDVLQEAGVPPWLRAQWPVLWLEGEAAAFADIVIGVALRTRLDALGARLRFVSRAAPQGPQAFEDHA